MSHDRLLASAGHGALDTGSISQQTAGAGAPAEPPGFANALSLADVLNAADVPASANATASQWADQPVATCGLAAAAESAGHAREFTRITLQDWGIGWQSDLAELVVSELVTNSLRHSLLSAQRMPEEHPIGLAILRRDPYLLCMVTDPGSGRPVRANTCTSAESGRGLQVVESCCVQWGWRPITGHGKVVWALLRSPSLRLVTRW